MATDGSSCPKTLSQLKWLPRFRCTGDRFASHASRRKTTCLCRAGALRLRHKRRLQRLRSTAVVAQLCLQIADDLILLAFSTCLVRICSARQETKKSQRVSPVSTKLSRATNIFLPRREFVSSCPYQKHQRCELSDTCQPLPDDRCHTPAMSRPKHPEASFPRKRTGTPLETPCSRTAIQLLSRNPTQTTCCPREARNSARIRRAQPALSAAAHDLTFVKRTVASPTKRPSSKPFKMTLASAPGAT